MARPSPLRRRVERGSAPVLVYLRSLPRAVPALLAGVLAAAGLFLTGPAGVVALLLIAVVLGWLLLLSWPVLPTAGRAVRLLTILLVLAAAVLRIRHH